MYETLKMWTFRASFAAFFVCVWMGEEGGKRGWGGVSWCLKARVNYLKLVFMVEGGWGGRRAVTFMALICWCCGAGQSQLLNLVFEVGEQDSDPDTPLQHTAAAWKYRTRITVDHFFRQFQLHVQSNLDDSANLPVLKLFFDEVCIDCDFFWAGEFGWRCF